MNLNPASSFLFKTEMKEYVTLASGEVQAAGFNCYVIFKEKKYEVGNQQAIVCLESPVLCLINQPAFTGTLEMVYTYNTHPLVSLTLEKKEESGLENFSIQLFTVCRTAFKNHSVLNLYFYYQRICREKAKYSFKAYLNMAGIFSYPRKVILVSAKCNDFVSVFPMDLQLYDRSHNMVFLGLRKSNRTNEFVGNAQLKISIAEFNQKNKDDVYAFGKFHSAQFPEPAGLPYRFIHTARHGNIFPDFIENYKELELVKVMDLGLQNLLMLKVSHVSDFDGAAGEPLYHLHYLALHA